MFIEQKKEKVLKKYKIQGPGCAKRPVGHWVAYPNLSCGVQPTINHN